MATYSLPDMIAELSRDEGLRLFPYRDSVGKLTIGIGRNLDDKGISREEAHQLLANDIADAEAKLDKHASWWRGMTPARQRGLLNMCFNMGWGDGSHGLSSFKNTLALLSHGQYVEAATSAMKSKWAKQVGSRAERITDQFIKG